MAEAEDPPVYRALMRLKPDDLKPGTWASRAGLARNIFNNIREHGNPKRETIERLLDAIQVSPVEFEALMQPDAAGGGQRGPSPQPSAIPVADPYRAFRGSDRPKDIPVLGTPSCGDMVVQIDGEERHIETIDMDLDEVIEFVRRPIGLDGRKDVYAIYPQGFSMTPRFEPGELQYVESGRRRPASVGDYVVVQLKAPDDHSGERIVSALLKRLVRQSADWIELEQFNPPMIFRVDRRRVAKIDRVLKLEELVAF